ncbi:zinc finger protein 92 homolog, partial [Lynx pardinus]
VPVSFEDVPVYFIKTGWKLLDLSQRILYKRVSLENYRHFVSLGKDLTPTSSRRYWISERNRLLVT